MNNRLERTTLVTLELLQLNSICFPLNYLPVSMHFSISTYGSYLSFFRQYFSVNLCDRIDPLPPVHFSKTCVKRPLINRQKILMTNGSLIKVESIAFDLHY